MHQSSLIVMAKAVSPGSKPIVLKESVKASYNALKSFHRSLDCRIETLRQSFDRWTSSGRKIAIYGGGIHTRALLELSGISPGQIHLIIDDDSAKQGRSLHGIPIYTPQQAFDLGMDVIVVSSLASEHQILDKLRDTVNGNIELVGIYRDLMNHER